jgi:peptidoglycan/xylan/chitin deacetylase (PgdA/CDA1 family)
VLNSTAREEGPVVCLMYHDVLEASALSGFPGKHAEIYKLSRNDFARHLEAIRPAMKNRVLLTFDDGGASAYDPIASMLEQYGWRGNFFVTTDCIGHPGFLTEEQIRELDRRGHGIGSHSCSHPRRFARLGPDRLVAEWSESARRLAGIVGHRVTVASVPGGDYTPAVARAAVQAGIETLFTSEPTAKSHTLDGCRVLGRYAIRRDMTPQEAGAIAAGQWAPRTKQAVLWKAKRVAKTMAGGAYFKLQRLVFAGDKD